jgi:uncharacterized repeat protein (TIGR01451 family)
MRRVVLLALIAAAVLVPGVVREARGGEAAVLTAPDIAMSISPGTIFVGGTGGNSTAVITYTIENFNDQVALTGLAFSHTFPAGQFLTASTVVSNTCGGTLTVTPGGNSVNLSNGATVNGPSNCQVKVNVQAFTLGDKVNSIPGGVSSSNAGSGPFLGDRTLKVNLRPMTLSKQFAAHNLVLNGTTTLALTVTNPNPPGFPLAAVRFTDTLPNGMEFASTTPTTLSCSQGSSTAGAASVSNKTATINFPSVAGGETCTVAYTVRVTQTGNISNTTSSVQTDTHQPDNSLITAGGSLDSVSVSGSLLPPEITKDFTVTAPTTGPIGQIYGNHRVAVHVRVRNPNPVAISNVRFTDTLPDPLRIAPANATIFGNGNIFPIGLNDTCPFDGTYTAPEGGVTASVSNQTIKANGQCDFYVIVTVPSQSPPARSVINVTSVIKSDSTPDGQTAQATLTILPNLAPPAISKRFDKSSVAKDGTVNAIITITNPNSDDLHEVAFTDPLPQAAGNVDVLEYAQPRTVTSSCSSINASQIAGVSSISLDHGFLPGGSSCTFTVLLTAVTEGQFTNQITGISSDETGFVTVDNVRADIKITDGAAPLIEKQYVDASGNPVTTTFAGQVVTLRIKVTNPSPSITMTNVRFSDPLPLALPIDNLGSLQKVGLGGTCIGTFSGGTTAFDLTGETLQPQQSCIYTVDVRAAGPPGDYTNITGAVRSNQTADGLPASAPMKIVAALRPPVLSKQFDRFSVPVGGKATLSITIMNPNPTNLTGVQFIDSLSTLGIRPSTPDVVTSSCAAIGKSQIFLGASSISLLPNTVPANTSCTFTISVDGVTPGTYLNQILNVTTNETGTTPLSGVSAVIMVLGTQGAPNTGGPGAGSNQGGGPGSQPQSPGGPGVGPG